MQDPELPPPQTPETPDILRMPSKSNVARWQTIVQYAIIVAVVLALTVVLAGRIRTAQHAVQGTQGTQGTHAASSGAGGSNVTWALVGQPAAEFTIQTYTWRGAPSPTSQTLRLAALHGTPIVVNFWASWCDACRAEAPLLEQTWQRYRSQGVVFIGLDFDDDEPDAVAFLQQYGITYLNGPDATEEIAVRYAVPGLPTTIFIDRKGVIAGRHIGQLDQLTLDHAIAALLR